MIQNFFKCEVCLFLHILFLSEGTQDVIIGECIPGSSMKFCHQEIIPFSINLVLHNLSIVGLSLMRECQMHPKGVPGLNRPGSDLPFLPFLQGVQERLHHLMFHGLFVLHILVQLPFDFLGIGFGLDSLECVWFLDVDSHVKRIEGSW